MNDMAQNRSHVVFHELLYPHRLDVYLRIEALDGFVEAGEDGLTKSNYAAFLRSLCPGDDDAVDRALANLRDAYHETDRDATASLARITARDMNGPHVAWLMPDRDTPTLVVPSRWCLIEGEDHLAALMHSGEGEGSIGVMNTDGVRAPDYTSLVARAGIHVHTAHASPVGPWPTPVPDRAESERLRARTEEHAVQIARYERQISEVVEELLALEERYRATRRALRRFQRIREMGPIDLSRAIGRRLRRLVHRIRPGNEATTDIAADASYRAPGSEEDRRGASAETGTPPTSADPTAGTLSKKQEAQRRELVRKFAFSGEVERLERWRAKFAGERCFIIGNGPSIRGQDLTLLHDEHTFVTNWFVNHPDFSAIAPKFYSISSHEVFGGWKNPDPELQPDLRNRLQAALPESPDTRLFFSFAFRDYIENAELFPHHEVFYLLFDRPKRQIDEVGSLNLDLARPMDDGYTGLITFCLPLARFMGFKTIYLLGADCDYGINRPSDPKQYFYDSKLHTTRTTKFESLQRIWADGGPVFQAYEIVRREFARDGIEIVNLTAGGRLDVFRRQRYEDVAGKPL